MSSISIKYSPNNSRFLKNFDINIKKQQNFEVVIIKSIPTFLKCLDLLSESWFKSQIVNNPMIIGIILKIREEIKEPQKEHPQIYEYASKDSLLISFQSTVGNNVSKTYWKIYRCKRFYSLYIEDDQCQNLAPYFHDFIVGEFKKGRLGFPKSIENKFNIKLHEIKDNDGRNLLYQAVLNNKLKIVKSLLNYEFDPDDVIDIAWENFKENIKNRSKRKKISKIILNLLRSNSRLPDKFSMHQTSKEIKDFVKMCENLHRLVDINDIEAIKDSLNIEPKLIYFYNRRNQSLLGHILRSKKYEQLELIGKGISTGSHEDLEEIYKNIATDKKSTTLRNTFKKYAFESTELHLLILKSKSRIGNNDQFSSSHWELINEAFDTLNSNNYCRKIMKVAAKFKNLKIYFDFKHDSTYYMDPATSYYSKGIIYESGSIFIGAKYLTDENKKTEVFGVLAHELCHLAVYIAFMNRNFDPFPTGESALKRRFIDQVMVQCKEREELEKIIANVFISYPENVQDSEMIVTVPQMMMQYVNNSAKIEELEVTFNELFKYSTEVVEPELEKSLPVLKILENEFKEIKFKELTDPMKMQIIHSKINFQGAEIYFNEIIGTDDSILHFLTSDNIRDILIRNKKLEIGSSCILNAKYGIIERSFIEIKIFDQICCGTKNSKRMVNNSNEIENYRKNFKQIRNSCKTVLVADHAGSGKTTLFKSYAEQLKNEHSNFWVSYINLKECAKIFESYKLKADILGIDETKKIFKKMTNPQSKLEEIIFKKLFSEGKSIMFFDGIDEICPKFTKILTNFMITLKSISRSNEILISTRPHYAEKLQEIFKQTPVYRFFPLTKDEIENFVDKILIKNNASEEAEYVHNKVHSVIYGLNQNYNSIDSNPLIIEMFTELCIQNEYEINSINFYAIYSAVVENQRKKLGEKIPIEDFDASSNFTIWKVHQVYALMSVFSNKLKRIKVEKFSIFKKWKKEKVNWTTDMIQRYGFLVVDPADNEPFIDFMHKTYAEFFVVQFFVTFLFDDHCGTDESEVKKIFNLFIETTVKFSKKYEILYIFFKSYIEMEKGFQNQTFDVKIKKLLTNEITKIHNILRKSFRRSNYFQNYRYFCDLAAICVVTDHEMLTNLWGINKGFSILKSILIHDCDDNFRTTLPLAEKCFGSEWHQKIDKSGKKLLDSKEIEKKFIDFEDQEWVQNEEKNLIKILEFVDINFNSEDLKSIYKRFCLYTINNNQILKEIVSRMKISLDSKTFAIKCLEDLHYDFISNDVLNFIFNSVEDALKENRELVSKLIIRYNICVSSYMSKIIWSPANPEVMNTIKLFHEKYTPMYQKP